MFRSSLLQWSRQPLKQTAPDVLAHVHFIRIVDSQSLLSVSASAPARQAALLALVSAGLDRWASRQSDHMILGGDWNASTKPRVGYVEAPPTVNVDTLLREWSEANELACETRRTPRGPPTTSSDTPS